MSKRVVWLSSVALLVISGHAFADDTPGFDRPGIAFSTSVVPAGGLAWEQGLPDFSIDRRDGVRTTTWVADTLFRLGVGDGVELQLGADTIGGVRVHGNGVDARDSGGGDGWAGVKWAPATGSDTFSWALLATRSLPFGAAPVGGGGIDYSVGATANWTLSAGTSAALYAGHGWGDAGSGWLLSPAYGFPLHGDLSGYVEAGYGTGSLRTRVAGGGVTWMATSRLQLDASFLRGLDGKSTDWQGGVGVAWYFDRRHVGR